MNFGTESKNWKPKYLTKTKQTKKKKTECRRHDTLFPNDNHYDSTHEDLFGTTTTETMATALNALVFVPDGLLMYYFDVLVSLCSEARPFHAHIDGYNFENVLFHFGTSAVMCSHLLAMRRTFIQTGLFLIGCPKSWLDWICHIYDCCPYYAEWLKSIDWHETN